MGSSDSSASGGTGVHEDHVIDLTAFDTGATGWWTASTGSTVVDAGRSSRWRRGTPPRTVPKGEKHAYRPGEVATACGLGLTELHVWSEHQFGDGLLNRCPVCVERVRAAGRPALQ